MCVVVGGVGVVVGAGRCGGGKVVCVGVWGREGSGGKVVGVVEAGQAGAGR